MICGDVVTARTATSHSLPFTTLSFFPKTIKKLALVACWYLKRINDTTSYFMIGYNNAIVKLQNYLEYFTKPLLKSLT